MKLVIAHTWDGRPADPAEVAALELASLPAGLSVRVDAPLHGDPPPRHRPGACDRLWEHEVVELFLVGADQRYLEVELGPHGHYLVLELAGRRNVVRRDLVIAYTVEHRGDRWSATTDIPWAWLPPGCEHANAFAIHGVGARRRYLAWAPVPGEGPDFHRLEHFPRLPLSAP